MSCSLFDLATSAVYHTLYVLHWALLPILRLPVKCTILYLFTDYQCGYGSDLSKVFTMYALKNGTDWSPRFAVYGDLGYQNGDHSIPLLTKEASDRRWDIVLHVGECLPACLHAHHYCPTLEYVFMPFLYLSVRCSGQYSVMCGVCAAIYI